MAAVTQPHKQDLLSSRIPLFFPQPTKKGRIFWSSYPISKDRKSPFMLKVGRGASFPPFFRDLLCPTQTGRGGGRRLKGLKGHQIVRGREKSRPPTSTTFLWGLGKREGMGFFSWGRG